MVLVGDPDELVPECPTEFRSDKLGTAATNKTGQISIDSLAALRMRLNKKKAKYRMAEANIEGVAQTAYRLEDIVQAKNTQGSVHW